MARSWLFKRRMNRFGIVIWITLAGCGPELVADDTVMDAADALSGTLPIGTTLKTTGNVNFRSGPSTSNSILDVAAKNTLVTTVNRTTAKTNFWNVELDGRQGWISANYLSLAPAMTGAGGGNAGTGGGNPGTGGGTVNPVGPSPCPGALGARTAVIISGGGSKQNPSFSPDGTRLLFTRFSSGYNNGQSSLGMISASGGAPTTVVPANAQNVDLPGSWNAALNLIVFSSDVGGDLDQIYLLDPSSSASPRLIATPGKRAWEPSLSPDGQWVVFEAHGASTGETPGRIWKVRTDGTQATQLTPSTVDAKEPNWSPRGDLILYQATGASGGNDIFVMDVNGGAVKNVTQGRGDSTDASWSPDGSSIVYSSDYSGAGLANLYVIPAAGGTPKRVTFGSGYDGAPSWSPDGRCIAFETSPGDPDSSSTTLAMVPAP